MGGAMVLPFFAGAGELAGATAGSAAAGAAVPTGLAGAGAGMGMADILSQAAAAPMVGAAPSIAQGIAPTGPSKSKQYMDMFDSGIRLGQLAGIGGEGQVTQAPQAPAQQATQAPPQAQGPDMPDFALAQPYQPSAVRMIELFNRRR